MIKVITGIRRCGKSSLMKLMANHLRESGISEDQIVEINFESMRFSDMTVREFYAHVSERVLPGKRMHLFFDEVQRLDGWENAVNSFRVDFDCDIQVTESMNAPETRERELAPLRKIPDNYEKIVIAMECGLPQDQDGIKIVNVMDFLLGQ